MKPEYIKRFEKLGYGMFVHFGLYSMLKEGEWYYYCNPNCDKKYYFSDEFANKFNPKKDWAIKLVKLAKKAGAKYITLTTKHHEGFCLYDSKGLTTWDAIHLGPKRDLVKEFVDACNQEGIIPFFYHAILDWHTPEFENDFPKFVDYLIKSVEILCTNYGKIGGLWFDGYWAKPNADWQFDRLYQTIRKYQPEAMIINNTGMQKRGEVSHYEIDSLTFERGKPNITPYNDGKERAAEMCEVFGTHWGYAENDITYKSIHEIISTLITCRYCNANLLLNVGPKGDGSIRTLDKEYLLAIKKFIKVNKNFIYDVRKADFDIEELKLLQDDKYYYAVIENIPMSADENVQLNQFHLSFKFPFKLKNPIYLDNKEPVILSEDKTSFEVKPFTYGRNYFARVVRFKK